MKMQTHQHYGSAAEGTQSKQDAADCACCGRMDGSRTHASLAGRTAMDKSKEVTLQSLKSRWYACAGLHPGQVTAGAHAPAAHPTHPHRARVHDPPAHLFVNSSAAGAASAGELATREAAAARATALTAAAWQAREPCWSSCACMAGILRDACMTFNPINQRKSLEHYAGGNLGQQVRTR